MSLEGNSDFDKFEGEFEGLSKEEILRIEVDSGLESALKELEILHSQLPKEQMASLLEICKDNVISTITNQFGLASAILGHKDGGNTTTTHNVSQGIYADEKDKIAYQNREKYNPDAYHNHKSYKKINQEQRKLKKEGKLKDYMTGEKINPNDSTDLDHILSAKAIHDDPVRVLVGIDGPELANTESNLKMTDSSRNRAKGDKSMEEFLKRRDERLQKLDNNEKKRGHLTQSEKNEKKKLLKQKEIDDDLVKKLEKQEEKRKDKKLDKIFYTGIKPYKELVFSGAKDAAMMAMYYAVAEITKEVATGLMTELREICKEWGNESRKEIIKRFKDRSEQIISNIKHRRKDIFDSSVGAAIDAFFSNILVFITNVFFTTMKRLVAMIRAGFVSLVQAIKILINPEKYNVSKEEAGYEASKILAAGLIGALSLGLQGAIEGLVVSFFPFLLPISDFVSVSISAIIGGILTTIVLFYMDKFRSQSKNSKLQIQLVAQGGVVVHYKVAQNWLILKDAYKFLEFNIDKANKELSQLSQKLDKMNEDTANDIAETSFNIAQASSNINEISSILETLEKTYEKVK